MHEPTQRERRGVASARLTERDQIYLFALLPWPDFSYSAQYERSVKDDVHSRPV